MENPIKQDDLGVPLFQETSMLKSWYNAIQPDVARWPPSYSCFTNPFSIVLSCSIPPRPYLTRLFRHLTIINQLEIPPQHHCTRVKPPFS